MKRSLLSSAVCFATLTASLVAGAEAAPITREALERRLLDTCVYRQFSVKDVKRASMIDGCRCASRTALKSFEGAEFEQPRSGGLTPDQERALAAGIGACFKP
ncbi:hypothetical protein [Chthonobacter rhizosphaerae]|uniref:hypothetical protein n=1 Tax=Chthonobacter rhizosphaerae TaxID=2735553 RepID=UPI0015EF7263|nr:hypothetical protein [Chthonobacter rhizosphaerae]